MTMKKPVATLDAWRFDETVDFPRLRGVVSGHPSFEDGELVGTSRLLRIDFEKGIAETKNTIYKLKERIA